VHFDMECLLAGEDGEAWEPLGANGTPQRMGWARGDIKLRVKRRGMGHPLRSRR
jgi:hypothetical protein